MRSLSSSGRTGTFVPTLEGDIRLELPSSRFDTPDGAFPEDGNVWEEGKAAGNPWPTALLFVGPCRERRPGSCTSAIDAGLMTSIAGFSPVVDVG